MHSMGSPHNTHRVEGSWEGNVSLWLCLSTSVCFCLFPPPNLPVFLSLPSPSALLTFWYRHWRQSEFQLVEHCQEREAPASATLSITGSLSVLVMLEFSTHYTITANAFTPSPSTHPPTASPCVFVLGCSRWANRCQQSCHSVMTMMMNDVGDGWPDCQDKYGLT